MVDGRRPAELSDCLARTVTMATLILTICNAVASHHTSLELPSGLTILPPGSMTRLKELICRDVKAMFDGTPAS